MKNQKGITLVSVVIYVIVLIVLIVMFAVIRGNFQNEIKEISNNSNLEAEFNKLNIYFLKEVNTAGNDININENGQEITFSLTGNKYAFSIPMKQINLISENNKVITILENVNSCNFELKTNEGKKTIVATISFEKDIDHPLSKEYTLVENVESRVYQDENDYVTTRLPKEYQEVEYISATGDQYIDTQVIPNQTFEIEIKVHADLTKSAWIPIYGNSDDYVKFRTTGYNLVYVKYGNDGNNYSGQLRNSEKIIKQIRNAFDFNTGSTWLVSQNEFSSTDPIYLFKICNDPDAYSADYFKIWYCKMWLNDNLVREFVPCYRKADGEIGLYDLVENEFYMNSGTGTFFKGEDV